MNQGRLLAKRQQRLSAYLESASAHHANWARLIGRANDETTTYERILFSLLSVGTSFESGSLAWLLLRKAPNDDCSTVESIIRSVRQPGRKSGTVAYPATKAADVVEFTRRFKSNPESFMLHFGESTAEWRARVNVRGLGLAKISFAAALLNPEDSPCVCLDRHMTRYFTGEVTRTPNPRQYSKHEVALVKIGKRYGISGFVAQWVVWDWLRGREESHLILAC